MLTHFDIFTPIKTKKNAFSFFHSLKAGPRKVLDICLRREGQTKDIPLTIHKKTPPSQFLRGNFCAFLQQLATACSAHRACYCVQARTTHGERVPYAVRRTVGVDKLSTVARQ
jgi:hypothetical protein